MAPRFIDAKTAVIPTAVTLAGLLRVLSLPRSEMPLPTLLVVAGLCLAYMLIQTIGLYHAERKGSYADRVVLCVAATAIGGAFVVLSRGHASLALHALVSQCVLYLSRPMAIAFICAISALNLGVVYGADPRSWLLLRESAAWFSGIAFVVIFSSLLLAKERARAHGAQLASDLAHANTRLRSYAREVEALTAMRERTWISREIHDGLGHYLTAAHVQLQAAAATLERDTSIAGAAIVKAQQLTQSALHEVRRSVATLREPPAPRLPLVRALEELASAADDFCVRVDVLGAPRELDATLELTLLRVAQEALTNVRRHADASHVVIELVFATDDHVRLRVEDDGVGCSDCSSSPGFGLVGLRERAALVGGKLLIDAGLPCGFALEVEVPG